MAERALLVALDAKFDSARNSVESGSHLLELRQHIRKWCLFWDRIGIVRNPNIMNGEDDDIEYLESVGFVSYFAVQHNGGQMAQTLHEVNLQALYALEQQHPGVWAADLSPGSIFCPTHDFFPSEHMLEKRGILVTLTNAIPVPDKDVPLAEVLEFKVKRQPELLAMRHHIEELYQRIGMAGDLAVALNTGMDTLSAAVNDAIRAAREQRLPFKMSSETASIAVAGSIAGALPHTIAEAPLTTVLANAAAGAVSLAIGHGWVRRKRAGIPFQYVSQYHEEVFVE